MCDKEFGFGFSDEADLGFSSDTTLDGCLTLGRVCLTVLSELPFPVVEWEM